MLKKNIVLVDARYSLQQNLPPLTQTPPRATVKVHGDWCKELNDCCNHIKKFHTTLFQAVDAPIHILEGTTVPEQRHKCAKSLGWLWQLRDSTWRT